LDKQKLKVMSKYKIMVQGNDKGDLCRSAKFSIFHFIFWSQTCQTFSRHDANYFHFLSFAILLVIQFFHMSQTLHFVWNQVKLLESASPDMIPLSAGFPNPELFPFSRATFETRDGQKIVLEDEKMIRALQYTGTPGFADLIEWFKKFQVKV